MVKNTCSSIRKKLDFFFIVKNAANDSEINQGCDQKDLGMEGVTDL